MKDSPELKKILVNYAKEYLKEYHIDINKYIFCAYINKHGVTAYVEARLRGTNKYLYIYDIYVHKDTNEILQSSKPSFD